MKYISFCLFRSWTMTSLDMLSQAFQAVYLSTTLRLLAMSCNVWIHLASAKQKQQLQPKAKGWSRLATVLRNAANKRHSSSLKLNRLVRSCQLASNWNSFESETICLDMFEHVWMYNSAGKASLRWKRPIGTLREARQSLPWNSQIVQHDS